MLTFSPISFKAKVKDFYAQGCKGPTDSSESITVDGSKLPQALVRRNPDASKTNAIKPGDVFFYKKYYESWPKIGKMIKIEEDYTYDEPKLIFINENKETCREFLNVNDDIYTVKEYKDEILEPVREESVNIISKFSETANNITSLTQEKLSQLQKAISKYTKIKEQEEAIEKLSSND